MMAIEEYSTYSRTLTSKMIVTEVWEKYFIGFKWDWRGVPESNPKQYYNRHLDNLTSGPLPEEMDKMKCRIFLLHQIFTGTLATEWGKYVYG